MLDVECWMFICAWSLLFLCAGSMSFPLSNWFHDSVSALAYSLAQPHAQSAELQPPYNDLTQFILRQHANLPDYLRTPMRLATLGFDAFGIVKGAKPFHRQTPPQRQRQIAAWKNASAGFQRDLIRYFESLATLALYSRNQDASPHPAFDHPLPIGWGEGRGEGQLGRQP